MKKSRYSPEQVTFCLRQAEAGTPVAEVCRKVGISEQTSHRWKKRFHGMGVAEVRRLPGLEEENRELKQLVADLSGVTSRVKRVWVGRRRPLVHGLHER